VEVRYTDDWDKIQEAVIKTHDSFEDVRLIPKYAFEIKYAVESIEHQKINVENSRRLGKASWVLAVLTGLLFLSTSFYACTSYMAYRSSEKQTVAIVELSKSIRALPKAPEKAK
jgi:hypothetical protein